LQEFPIRFKEEILNMQYEFNNETVKKWCYDTLLDAKNRDREIQNVVRYLISLNPQLLVNFLKSLAAIKIFELVLEKKGIDFEILKQLISWRDAVYLNTVKVLQESPYLLETCILTKAQKTPKLYFSAAIPKSLHKDFVTEYMHYYDNNQFIKNELWKHLNDLFNFMASKIFPDKYKAFPTKGTLSSFESIAGFLNNNTNIYWVIGTLGEYQPMLSILPRDRVFKANLKNPFCSIDDIIEQIKNGIQHFMAKKYSKIIVLLSSSLRIGGIYLNIDTISESLSDLRKNFELWIDSSQDNRTFETPDIIWFSKWHVETGGGIVLVSKTYKDVKLLEQFQMRSGFDPKYIAKACASLQFYETGVPFSFIELNSKVDQWGNIKYMQKLLTTFNDKIKSYNLTEHIKLYCNYDMNYERCIPGIVCRINIISSKKTATDVRHHLRDKDIFVDAFELNTSELEKGLHSSDFDSIVNNFSRNNTEIIWELLPPLPTEDYKTYFHNAVGYHRSNVRIYISCDTTYNDIEILINTLHDIFNT
jgi:hypothetical protein